MYTYVCLQCVIDVTLCHKKRPVSMWSDSLMWTRIVFSHTHAHIRYPRDCQLAVAMETSCDVNSAHVHPTVTLVKLATCWRIVSYLHNCSLTQNVTSCSQLPTWMGSLFESEWNSGDRKRGGQDEGKWMKEETVWREREKKNKTVRCNLHISELL